MFFVSPFYWGLLFSEDYFFSPGVSQIVVFPLFSYFSLFNILLLLLKKKKNEQERLEQNHAENYIFLACTMSDLGS